jgi:phospholipid/cholesterol/gamma-HCH transport system permease protein
VHKAARAETDKSCGDHSRCISVVFTYWGSDQLRHFGADVFTVKRLGVGVLSELGGLMAAIIAASRPGATFAAQVGTRTLGEQIDAIQVTGFNVVAVLIVPRLLGIVLTLPPLTFYIMGLLSGAAVCYLDPGITIAEFLHQMRRAVVGWTVWVGVITAPAFAFIIGLSAAIRDLSPSATPAALDAIQHARLSSRSLW